MNCGITARISFFVCALGLICSTVAQKARAANDTWIGGGADGKWKTAGNWNSGTGNAPPVALDVLNFAGNTNLSTSNDFTAATQFNGINFSAGAGSFTLAGNSVLLGGDINNNSGVAQTISLPLLLDGATHNVNVAAGGSLSLGSLTFGAAQKSANVSTLNINNTVSATSLNVQTDSTSANVININNGSTLNLSGSFIIGTPPPNPGSTSTNGVLNIAGDGTFNLTTSTNANFNVGVGAGSNTPTGQPIATVDMTGLANFIYSTGATGTGTFGVGNLVTRASSTLRLANTSNTITSASVVVGDSNQAGGNNSGQGGFLFLGAGTNVINTNTINVGFTKSTGTIQFQGSTGSVTIGGQAGGNSTTNITIGRGSSATDTGTPSQLLLAGHQATVQAGTVQSGVLAGATGGTPRGDITFDTGTFNVSSLQLGVDSSGTAANGAIGTFTLGGASANTTATGVLNVSTAFLLGNVTSTNTATKANTATFTINGGTANINTDITRVLASAATGTTQNSTINLNAGVLDMMGHAIGTSALPITFKPAAAASQTATLQNLGGTGINGAGLTMNGLGTLILAGNNGYAGATEITSGKLFVNGTTAAGNAVHVNGGTLGGTGTISGAVTMDTGTLTSGATPGASSGALTLAGLTTNGGTLSFNIGTSTTNTITLNGPVTFNNANLGFVVTGSPANGAIFTLLTASSPLVQGGLNLSPVTVGRGTVTPSISGNNLMATVAGVAPAHLTWTGTDANSTQWDNFGSAGGGTANWTTAESVTDKTHFYDGDSVTFAGAAQGALNLVSNSGTLTPGGITVSAGTYTFNGNAIGGAGPLAISGTGNLTLNNGNTNYTGNVTIDTGSLTLGASGASGSGSVTLNSGTLNVNAAGALGTGLLTIGAGATLNNTSGSPVVSGVATPQTWLGDFTFTGSSDLDIGNGAVALTAANSTVTVSAGTLTVGGVISGTGDAITKAGAGTLLLKGDNTFTGGVTVNAGTLQANRTTSGRTPLGSGNTTVNAGGILIGGNADAFGFTVGSSPTAIFVNGGTITDIAGAYRVTLPNLTFTGGTLTSDVGNTGDANGQYSLRGDATTATVTTNAASSTAVISAGTIAIQSPTVFNVAAGTVVGGPTPGVDLLVSSVLKNFGTTVTSLTKTGAGTMVLSGDSTYTGPTNVNAGKLVLKTSPTNSTNNISTSPTVTVANGATLDVSDLAGVGGFSVPFGQSLVVNGAVTGLVNVSGGNLAGTSTGNAATVNLAGGRITPGASSADGNIGTVNIGSLTTAGGDIHIDGQTGNVSDLVNIIGTANFSGGATVSVTPATPTGTYTIITAGSLLNSGSLSLLNQTFNRIAYSLNFSQANKVLLNVSGGPASLTWNNNNGSPSPGDGTTWDIQGNNNWTSSATTGIATQYYDADSVTFNDSNNGHYTVNLLVAVNPGSITVNNSAGDYVFANAGGSIGGTASLTKSGSKALTLAQNNTYTGGTVLSQGTLNLNSATAIGTGSLAISGGTTIDNTSGGAIVMTANNAQSWGGSFTFTGAGDGSHDLDMGTGAVTLNANPTVTVSAGTFGVGAVADGTGNSLIKDGSGTLFLKAGGSYTGTTNINAGTLKVGGVTLGATTGGNVTVASGAALDLGGNATANNENFGTKLINIAGTGPDGNGAIVNNNGAAQQNALQKVALTADATVGAIGTVGVATGRFDIRAGQAAGVNVAALDMNGHTLTKKGAGQFTLVATTVSSTGGTPGAIVVSEGELGLETTTIIGPSAVSSVTMNQDTRLEFFGNTAAVSTVTSPVIVAGTGVSIGPGNNGPIIGSPITLQNDVTFVPITTNAASLTANNGMTLTGAIGETGGPHGIIKNGVNTLTLSGNNTYTGATTINGGTLLLGAADRIADASNMVISGGTFATGGFDEKVSTLNVLSAATANAIDLGTTGASLLRFDNSSSLGWGGTLAINNWSNGLDRLFVGTDATGLTPTQLSSITFNGFGAGAAILSTGEIYPLGIAPVFLQGDWNRDGVTNAADIPAMLTALTDLTKYEADFNVLNNQELTAIGDWNGSGTVTNADIQGELDYVIAHGGAGSVGAVPEPSTLLLAGFGAVGFAVLRMRRKAK